MDSQNYAWKKIKLSPSYFSHTASGLSRCHYSCGDVLFSGYITWLGKDKSFLLIVMQIHVMLTLEHLLSR